MATPQQIVKGQGVLLRKMIEKYPKCIADAKAILLEWSKIKCDVSVATHWIREPILKKNLGKFGDLFKAPELLTIEPIGLNNMGHNNAIEFSALYPNEFECVVGYNVCSCKCGAILAYEVHSVVKDKATGKHYDITKDFAGEKKKWFVPMKLPNEMDCLKMKKALGQKYDIFAFGYDECKCSVNWKNTSPPLNIKKFKQDIEELEYWEEEEEDDFILSFFETNDMGKNKKMKVCVGCGSFGKTMKTDCCGERYCDKDCYMKDYAEHLKRCAIARKMKAEKRSMRKYNCDFECSLYKQMDGETKEEWRQRNKEGVELYNAFQQQTIELGK